MIARVTGITAVIGAAGLVVARFLPYLVIAGDPVLPPRGVLDVLAALLWPGMVIGAGVSVVRGRLPRLGLAVIGASGGLAVGRALREIYQLADEQSHPGTEAFFGNWLVTSSIGPAVGVWLTLASYLLLVSALPLTLLAWPRTVMEDAEDFEPLRPLGTGIGAAAGFLGLLAVAAAPMDLARRTLTGPGGFVVVVDEPGPASLLDQVGFGLAGTLALASAVVVLSVTAATLRPRLATVGVFAALAGYFIGSAAGTALDAGRSTELALGLGGVLQIAAAVVFSAAAGWSLTATSLTGTATRPDRWEGAATR
ncbi:hypothetical protein BH20ACT5_BH20ACT5_00480 [soil metagenome]